MGHRLKDAVGLSVWEYLKIRVKSEGMYDIALSVAFLICFMGFQFGDIWSIYYDESRLSRLYRDVAAAAS